MVMPMLKVCVARRTTYTKMDLYSGPVARNALSFTTGVVMKSELHGVPCTACPARARNQERDIPSTEPSVVPQKLNNTRRSPNGGAPRAAISEMNVFACAQCLRYPRARG